MSEQNAALAKDSTKVTATRSTETTYVGFIVDGDGVELVGEVTVKVGRSDLAKDHFLAQQAEAHPDVSQFTVAVVPSGSWKPETFGPAPVVQPKFVKVG